MRTVLLPECCSAARRRQYRWRAIRARSRTEKRCGGAPRYPAAPFYAEPPAHAELLLGYASLEEAQIRAGIRELRRALDGLRPGRHAESGSPPGS